MLSAIISNYEHLKLLISWVIYLNEHWKGYHDVILKFYRDNVIYLEYIMYYMMISSLFHVLYTIWISFKFCHDFLKIILAIIFNHQMFEFFYKSLKFIQKEIIFNMFDY